MKIKLYSCTSQRQKDKLHKGWEFDFEGHDSLHPEAQVEKGKEIVRKIKDGELDKVCLFSWSPFFIESIYYHAQELKLKAEDIKFFLDDKDIDTLEDGMGAMFKHISDPLDKMIWGDDEGEDEEEECPCQKRIEELEEENKELKEQIRRKNEHSSTIYRKGALL